MRLQAGDTDSGRSTSAANSKCVDSSSFCQSSPIQSNPIDVQGKRAMLITTTGGPDSMYGRAGINGAIEMNFYHITHGLFFFWSVCTCFPFGLCFRIVWQCNGMERNEWQWIHAAEDEGVLRSRARTG